MVNYLFFIFILETYLLTITLDAHFQLIDLAKESVSFGERILDNLNWL